MQFELLDIKIPDTPTKNEDGTWSGKVVGIYGVVGNPYENAFLQTSPRLSFTSSVTNDTTVIEQAAQDVAIQYKDQNYPNT